MAETNPVGVPVAPSGDGVSVEDAATQILQSGLLDEDEYIPSQNRDHAVGKAVEQEEDEEESDDSDAEQPEEDSEEEPDEEEANEEPTYTIKLNGKTERVSLDELTNGYQRGADYTHKTQELSRSRREFDAERQAVANERGQYQNALAQFQQILVEQHAPYENIDWAELAEIDPAAYVTKKEEQRDLKDRYAQTQQEQAKITYIQNQESARQKQIRLSDEGEKLASAFPDWRDNDKRSKMSQSWTDYALSNGFSKEEVDGVVDHRSFVLLDKAMKYDKIQRASLKKGKVVNVPKTVKSGVARSLKGESSTKMKAKMQKLQQSGSLEDAASVFFDFV